MDGHFDGNSLVVDLEISGLLSPQPQKIPITLDTGFTGDLCLTYQVAFPLGLTLVGLENYILGDGSQVTFFSCLGLVSFEGKQIPTVISIRNSGSLLMGVSLLKKLNSKLDVDFVNQKVVLSEIVKPIPTPTKNQQIQ